VNWSDYVVLAEALVAERHEASQRSAVSRAYYGTLNACRLWLETNVAPINKHRIHAQVWGAFETGGRVSAGTEREWELIADLGSSLRALRNRADYGDSFPGLEHDAVEAVGTAKRILALLAKLEPVD
jgi:hypothetical protein